MLKKIVLLSCLAPIAGFASDHVIEFKSERRGDTFKRHFAELHSNFGQVGWGYLNTTWELNGTTTEAGTITNIHPGFSYLLPVTEHFFAGPVAKYNYIAGKDDAIKAGIGWAYSGFSNITLGGQVRYDHQLGNNSFDMVRTDLIFGFSLSESFKVNTTTTNMSPIKGQLNAWQEMEIELKYTGFDGFHPYLGTTLTTDNDPLGRGDNAYIIGFYMPF